jgi:hypothetical protein
MTLNLYTENAEELMMGTAAQESHLGSYIRQVEGPALGIFQCEQKTYDSIWNKYIGNARAMQLKVLPLIGVSTKPPFHRLISDLNLATIMCRLYYWDIQIPLPYRGDVAAMGKYWNDYYNRNPDKGTVEEFVANYAKYVK